MDSLERKNMKKLKLLVMIGLIGMFAQGVFAEGDAQSFPDSSESYSDDSAYEPAVEEDPAVYYDGEAEADGSEADADSGDTASAY